MTSGHLSIYTTLTDVTADRAVVQVPLRPRILVGGPTTERNPAADCRIGVMGDGIVQQRLNSDNAHASGGGRGLSYDHAQHPGLTEDALRLGFNRPLFPKSRGHPRVDELRVLSGIIFINRNVLRRRDAPRQYGPAKFLYNRWSRKKTVKCDRRHYKRRNRIEIMFGRLKD